MEFFFSTYNTFIGDIYEVIIVYMENGFLCSKITKTTIITVCWWCFRTRATWITAAENQNRC